MTVPRVLETARGGDSSQGDRDHRRVDSVWGDSAQGGGDRWHGVKGHPGVSGTAGGW